MVWRCQRSLLYSDRQDFVRPGGRRPHLDGAQQRHIAALEADCQPDEAAPQSRGGRDREGVGRAGTHIAEAEAARLRLPQILDGNELEIDAMIGDDAEEPVARVLDGDDSFGTDARFQGEDARVAEESCKLFARGVGWPARVEDHLEHGPGFAEGGASGLLADEIGETGEASGVAGEAGDRLGGGASGEFVERAVAGVGSDSGAGPQQGGQLRVRERFEVGCACPAQGSEGGAAADEEDGAGEQTGVRPGVESEGECREEGGAVPLHEIGGDDQRRRQRDGAGEVVNGTGPGDGVAVGESAAVELPEVSGGAQRHEPAEIVLGANAGEVVIVSEASVAGLLHEAFEDVESRQAEHSVGDEPRVPLEVEECSGGVRAEDAVHPAAVEAEQREASLQLTDVVTTLVGHGMEQGSLAENSARLDQRQPGL